MAHRRITSGRHQGLAPRVRALVSGLALASIATLVLLHVAVLWDRVAEGRLSDPVVALRWLAGAVLTLALLALRRRGVPLLWGRRALVFWLLVLLLHAGAAAPEGPGLRPDPVRLLFVVPASVAPIGLLLVLLVPVLVRRSMAGPAPARARRSRGAVAALREGVLLTLAPRAPPA